MTLNKISRALLQFNIARQEFKQKIQIYQEKRIPIGRIIVSAINGYVLLHFCMLQRYVSLDWIFGCMLWQRCADALVRFSHVVMVR